MKKRITKLSAMLLAAVMLLSVVPVSAVNPEISPLRLLMCDKEVIEV